MNEEQQQVIDTHIRALQHNYDMKCLINKNVRSDVTQHQISSSAAHNDRTPHSFEMKMTRTLTRRSTALNLNRTCWSSNIKNMVFAFYLVLRFGAQKLVNLLTYFG